MKDIDIIARIKELLKERGWSVYRLAKESGIPYSTLNNMFHRPKNTPSAHTLLLICNAFGITLSDFFMEDVEEYIVTEGQRRLLDIERQLCPQNRGFLFAYAEGMLKVQQK